MAYQDEVAGEEAAGSCPRGHRRSDWYDEDGKELRTPPYVVDAVQCPACELLEEWGDTQKDSDDKGIFPIFVPNLPADDEGED